MASSSSNGSQRRLISSGSPFEAQIGYSRAVVDGDFVFVSGCTGLVQLVLLLLALSYLSCKLPRSQDRPKGAKWINYKPTEKIADSMSRYDYQTGQISPSVVEQTEQTMKNIQAALEEAGAKMEDIVRVRYILPDRADFPATWPVLQRYLGDVRPAATMIQAGLMEEIMLIEVEVTARVKTRD